MHKTSLFIVAFCGIWLYIQQNNHWPSSLSNKKSRQNDFESIFKTPSHYAFVIKVSLCELYLMQCVRCQTCFKYLLYAYQGNVIKTWKSSTVSVFFLCFVWIYVPLTEWTFPGVFNIGCCRFLSIYHSCLFITRSQFAENIHIKFHQTIDQHHCRIETAKNSKYKHVLNPAHNLMIWPFRNGHNSAFFFVLLSNIKYMFLWSKRVRKKNISWLSLVSLWQWYINFFLLSLFYRHRHIFMHSLAFTALPWKIHL